MDRDILVDNLQKRGYETVWCDSSEAACNYMVNRISGKSIGIGGTMTVLEIGLADKLKENNTIYWHWDKELVDKHGAGWVMDKAMGTDVYISSVNAISETGVIVNIDGNGNRISSLAFGHKEIYYIIGRNKVAKDTESAIWRARNIASPLNARRLNKRTPCAVKADRCYDCNSPDRICNGFLIHERPMRGMKTVVVLIDEDLGM